MTSHVRGEAVQIIRTAGNNAVLNVPKLEQILLAESLRDKPVVVFSVAGSYRTGKSFLLNYVARYMTALVKNKASRHGQWLSECIQSGFFCKGGSERITSGVWLWSHPFVLPVPGFGEVAVILMDTQGLYDRHSSLKDNTNLFALSACLSSIQIFNLQGRLQSSDLEYLKFFGEYAKLLIDEDRPFQRLTMLVRDWQLDSNYGFGGGSRVLESFFFAEDASHGMRAVAEKLYSSFDTVDCYLMPHPGKKIACGQFFGDLEEMDPDFNGSLCDLIPKLLAPGKLVVKKLAGNAVSCCQLLDLFERFTTIFNGSKLPEPRTIFECMVDATNSNAVEIAKGVYTKEMKKAIKGDPVKRSKLELDHKDNVKKALGRFNSLKTIGGCRDSYRERLIASLERKKARFFDENDRKIEVYGAACKEDAETEYRTKMAKLELGKKYQDPTRLFLIHKSACAYARDIFQPAADLGADASFLEEFFELSYAKFKAQNQSALSNFLQLEAHKKLAELKHEKQKKENAEKQDSGQRKLHVHFYSEHVESSSDCLPPPYGFTHDLDESGYDGHEYSPPRFMDLPTPPSYEIYVPKTSKPAIRESNPDVIDPKTLGAIPPFEPVTVVKVPDLNESGYGGHKDSPPRFMALPTTPSYEIYVPKTSKPAIRESEPVEVEPKSLAAIPPKEPVKVVATPDKVPPGKVFVNGYTRHNGTQVAGYYRSTPSTKPSAPEGKCYVSGYTRNNGTHVEGYHRNARSANVGFDSASPLAIPSGKTYVSGYIRSDGTAVPGYLRSARK